VAWQRANAWGPRSLPTRWTRQTCLDVWWGAIAGTLATRQTRPSVWLGAIDWEIGWEQSVGPSVGEHSPGPRRRSIQRR
jgi:hypothetical protein